MRCPDCQKFVSLDTEIDDGEADIELQVTDTEFQITGEVRVVRNCTDCGNTLKSGTFEVDETVPRDLASELECGAEGEPELGDVDCEATETGGGRYKKNMVGFSLSAVVKRGDKTVAEFDVSDSMAASFFDEEA